MIPLGQLRAFAVVSPEYEMSRSGYEPPEWGADYRLVFARTKRRARVLAVASWRRGWGFGKQPNSRAGYINKYNEENPFKGLTVYEVTEHAIRGREP
jgi:hypothetical protein